MAIQNSKTRDNESRHLVRLVDQRAHGGHERPFAIVPKSKDLSQGFTEVSYKLLANAVNRVAWWLEDMTNGPKPGTIFSWSGPNDIRYTVFVLAATKCRYKLLLPSPRNSEEYQRTIFKAAGCQFACGTKATLSTLKKPLEGLSIRQVEGISLEQVLDPEPVPSYPVDFDFEEIEHDTPLILHTSGSTGPPKAIPIPLDCLTTVALRHVFPEPRERHFGSVFEHTRLFCGFPPFHACAGGVVMCAIWPILWDLTIVWAPSGRPLNHSIAAEAIRSSGAESATIPPSVLEDMAKSSSGMDALSTLQFVCYAGGPLPRAIGDKVSKKTKVLNAYGATETLVIPSLIPSDREDWNYIELDPRLGYEFEHFQEDLYNLVIRRVPEIVPIQPVFLLMPDIDEFSTGDLVSPHPTKPNLWCIKGRKDDLVILSSGEKFDPAPGEAVVRESPLVRNCLLVGRERPQALLLVERDPETTANMSSAQEVAEALWPVVEEMNRIMATQAHITPGNIVVAPLGTEFPRTPKGSVRRKATEEAFQSELDAASGDRHASSRAADDRRRKDDGQVTNGSSSAANILQAMREVVFTVCRNADMEDDDDLFDYGLDSIQAQQISAALRKLSNSWPEDTAAAINIIYSKPTIRGLFEAINTNNGQQQNGQEAASGMDIDTLIQKHTSDLPIPSRSSREQFTVAITGSTGNLGCHMLNDLIQHPRVAKVVCLNRASPGKEAQDDAFRRNKLKHDTSSESQNTMVLHYKIDLSDPFLGLTPAQYTTLHREVDVLIHNAWQLDFLRTVNAFEKTHIAGVRHIVNLAAGSCRDMRIIFISSIGAVAGTSIDTFSEVPETPAKPGILPGGNGYSQSKFVGERILEEAVSKSHVKSSIIRVGQIAGPTTEATGTWSTTDWFPRIMASAELLRTVPDQLGISDTVDWLPIDTVSRVVMDIFESTVLHPSSDQDLSDQGPNVFHIINPHIVPWKKLAPDVASFLGKDVRLLSLADWIADVRAAVGAKGPGVVPVEALLSWLDGMMTGTKLPRLAVEKTMAVSPALASPGPVQSSWIGRWMMDWRL